MAVFIGSVPCVTRIFGKAITPSSQLNAIEPSVKKQGKPITLSALMVRLGSACHV